MKKPFFHRISTFVVMGLIVVILIARIILPGIILNHTNEYLANFSPLYSMHVDDLNLHLYRLAYSGENVTGRLKKKPIQFFSLDRVTVSIALRELLRGKVVVDVVIKHAALKLTTETIDAVSGVSKDQAKSDAKNVKDATIPFSLETVHVKDSSFEFSDVGGLPPEQTFYLADMNVVADNLTPESKDGLSIFTATGDLQGKSKVKVVGQMQLNHTPTDWSINLVLKDFDLPKLNPIARRMIPLTFKSGTLSLYLATQSVDDKVLGYVKPFIKNMVLIGDKGDFKNIGQVFIEIGGTLGNFFLKNSKNHALATKIEFKTENGKIVSNASKAIKIAADNAFGDALPQKIDETLDLK
jgi:hypothetical protein